jgi:hypothetical protein
MTGTFYVGTTILQLEVTDNTGDKAAASTYVSLRAPAAWETKPPEPTSVEPATGATYGGESVTVRGYGFYYSPRIFFGKREAKVLSVVSNTELLVEAPPGSGRVAVAATNGYGEGAATVDFDYYESDVSPIVFYDDVVKHTDGSDFFIQEITSIALGPDGLYYACSLDGYIYVLEMNKDMQVVSYCKSPQMGDQRAAMGIAFHPSDTSVPPKAFVSTSTLYWKNKKTGQSWNNGKVEVWQKGAGGGDCIDHQHDVVSGLPVSNHDHGVNAINFLPDGDMLVANGGSTNAGIHTNDDGIGGIPESPLSSAILRFKLSKGANFDGQIKYDQTDDPATAHVVSGDVDVYASGVRNCFGFTRHSSGAVYAMSNGANSGFGLESRDCSTTGGSVSAQDSLLNIKENSYYGHPNRNRGRYDERQCSYAAGDEDASDRGATEALHMFGSSTNGMVEYTANTFDFQLRGNLFLSKLAWQGPGLLHRVVLSEDGERVDEASEVWGDGGLSMVMSPYGDLVMPKVKHSQIFLVRPDYRSRDAVHLRAVSPHRGPARGGYAVMVTGSGFGAGMSVSFGGRPCDGLSRMASDGSSVWCDVPAGKVGTKVSVVVTVAGQSSKRYDRGDFEYVG